MTDNVLIVVHGMGEHTEASILSEVTASIDSALKLYPETDSGLTAATAVDIIPVV